LRTEKEIFPTANLGFVSFADESLDENIELAKPSDVAPRTAIGVSPYLI
jgi:hypothetical protein